MSGVGSRQLRAVIFVVSSITIAAEIILMRELALRFWEHLAWLVISVALLGFGASGTVLVLVNRLVSGAVSPLHFGSLLGMALSFPLCLQVADGIDFDLVQIAWQPVQLWKLGALQAVLAIPFLFSGMFIALALQGKPGHVPGHYSASFVGSAAGALMILPAFFFLPPRMLILGCSMIIMAGALACIRRKRQAAAWGCSAILLALLTWQFPLASTVSQDKAVPQITAMPASRVVDRQYGPQGLVQVLDAPAVHAAPGLSLMNADPVPEQRLVALDAEIAGQLYEGRSAADFAFLDSTTQALPYRFGSSSNLLIGNATGNGRIGLALYHGVDTITVLTENRSFKRLLAAEISRSDNLDRYGDAHIQLEVNTLHGYLDGADRRFSLIVLPTTGADFGGLRSAVPDSLFTLETFRSCLAKLTDSGLLAVTTHAHSPPRESLRLLNMFIDVLNDSGREPRNHIAVVRNWATVTLVASKSIINARQTARIRAFTGQKGFDLVWLPDLSDQEVNEYHILDEPQYYLGAKNLLGPQKEAFMSTYVYDLGSPESRRPFFHHFSRFSAAGSVDEQLGRRSRAYTELGTALLIGALALSFVLALVLIVLPLIPAVGLPGKSIEHISVLGFFAAIGFGFMLLEMGLLQFFTVYLAHPVYAASAVLSGFLFFGGIGSGIAAGFKDPLTGLHFAIGAATAGVGLITLLTIEPLLAAADGLSLPAKMAVVFTLTGPAAVLMGMMFPLGLKRVGRSLPRLSPWAWSVNGFASVVATLCTPLVAMRWGFDTVGLAALGCYMLAAFLSLGLPEYHIE